MVGNAALREVVGADTLVPHPAAHLTFPLGGVLSLHPLPLLIVNGTIDEIIDTLVTADQAARLEEETQ